MRKKVLLLALLALFFALFSNKAFAQECMVTAGTPVPPLVQYCLDGSNNPDDLIVTNYETPPSGGDFMIEYIVTMDDTIIGVTEWSYAGISPGGGFDISAFGPGTYTFTGIVFQQSYLDAISGNPILSTIFGTMVGTSLGEFINPIQTQQSIPVPDPFIIDALVAILENPLLGQALGFQPCVAVAETSFTVEVVENCGGEGGNATVPTMSQWGLFLLALFLMNLGVITIQQTQISSKLVGNKNISFSITKFPFDVLRYRQALHYTLPLAVLGFVFIFLVWGELVLADFIGMSFSIPLVAYLLHLLKDTTTK